MNYIYNTFGNVKAFGNNTIEVDINYDEYNKVKDEAISLSFGGHSSSLSNRNNYNYEYKYKFNQLAELVPVIKQVKRNAFGQITFIEYENGLTLLKTFRDGTTLLESTTFESRDSEVLFNEILGYNEFRRPKRSFDIITSVDYKIGLAPNNKRWPMVNDLTYEFKDAKDGKVPFKRYRRSGNVTEIDGKKIQWNDDNLAGIDNLQFFYDSSGALVASCPKDVDKITTEQCLIKYGQDLVVYQNNLVKLIQFDGISVAVQINDKIYPVLADHLGSIRVMMSEDGKRVLWERSYSLWGSKTVYFGNNESDSESENRNVQDLDEIKKLENLTVWSFAGLMEVPGLNSGHERASNLVSQATDRSSNFEFYWSGSRVYSPQIKEWMSVDPVVKWNPKALLSKPGNWHPVKYAANNPLNYTDSSGQTIEDAMIAWDFARKEFSSLPQKVNFIFILDYKKTGGMALSPFNTVLLADTYKEKLSKKYKLKLLTTVMHEAQHFKDGFWETAKDALFGGRDKEIDTTLKHIEIFNKSWDLTDKYKKDYLNATE